MTYDRALIATGAEPNRLPIPGFDLEGYICWTLDNSTAIRREIELGAKRVLIVGGGYIGVEVAADCLQKGVAVTLVEQGNAALGPICGPACRGLSRGSTALPRGGSAVRRRSSGVDGIQPRLRGPTLRAAARRRATLRWSASVSHPGRAWPRRQDLT